MKSMWILLFTAALSACGGGEEGAFCPERRIMNRVQETIRNTHLLTFQCLYISRILDTSHPPGEVSGAVWLERLPGDSFFGARFHIAGRQGENSFDYHYDGQQSYDIWHRQKTLYLLNPHDHPDNPQNPARARVALLPFPMLLIDDHIRKTLLERNPRVQVSDDEGNRPVLTLTYPENEYGQRLIRTLYIDRGSHRIVEIVQDLAWQGITTRTRWIISGYGSGEPGIRQHIPLTGDFSGYTRETKTPLPETPAKTVADPFADLIGESAPDFSGTTLSGEPLSLNQFRGKMVLLDFWEYWCGYCRITMPELKALQGKYAERLVVIGITTDERELVEKIVASETLNYPNLFLPKDILRRYRVSARPVYVLIGLEGRILRISSGDLRGTVQYFLTLLKRSR